MLRPDHVIEYFKSRANLRLSDFDVLVDGVQIGTTIVVGGGAKNVQALMPVMAAHRKLASIVSVNELDPKQIDVKRVLTFDLAAIAQLLMVGKNEAFHATIDQAITFLQKVCVDEDQPIEVGLSALRDLADQIQRM